MSSSRWCRKKRRKVFDVIFKSIKKALLAEGLFFVLKSQHMARIIAKKEIDLPLFAGGARKFLTISELNERIKGTLESRLEPLWVQGEISNFRMPPSGHFYFTLKDDKSQICAVMFRRQGTLLALHAGKRHGGVLLWPGECLYRARRSAALCRRHGAAGAGRAVSGLRAAEEEARRGRFIRQRTQTRAAVPAPLHRHRDFRQRRRVARYAAHHSATVSRIGASSFVR